MDNPTPTTTAPTSTHWGCWVGAGLGCLALIVIVGGLVAALVVLMISRNDDTGYYQDNADAVVDINKGVAITEPLSPDEQAYQIVAYPELSYSQSAYPSIRATLPYTLVDPLPTGDNGFLWLGITLDNGYFIQVGMSSSQLVDKQQKMRWNYFWEVWDDNDQYLYGYQEPMDDYGWDDNAAGYVFTISCQDPDKGVWEFWVDDETVGTTTTGSCAMDLANAALTWEVVTAKTPQDTLPQFGPFTLGGMQYWDDYDWVDVPSAALTYGYGYLVAGTESDPASVCPPYGASATTDGSLTFTAGSNLPCLDSTAQLWTEAQ